MYELYENISPPPLDAVLWRYMSFNHFVSLLENSALWFTRIDKFDDEHEGAIPLTSLEAYESRFVEAAAMAKFVGSLKHFRSFTLANCWHWNSNENVAMWDRYCKGGGIAVRATFSNLTNSFACPDPIHIGLVNYIDYREDEFSTESIFPSYLHKRLEYKDEREVRALSYLLSSGPLRWVKITPDLVSRCEIGELPRH